MAAQRLLKFGFTATSALYPPLHLLSRGSRLPVHISRVAPLASSIFQEPTLSSSSVPGPRVKKQTFPKGVSSVAGQKMKASACSKPSLEKPLLRQRSPKPASTASAKSQAAAPTREAVSRKTVRDNRCRPWLVNSTLAARPALPTRSKLSSSLMQAPKSTASDTRSMIRGRLSLCHDNKAKKTVRFADNIAQTIVVERWIVRALHVDEARSLKGSLQFELEDRLLAVTFLPETPARLSLHFSQFHTPRCSAQEHWLGNEIALRSQHLLTAWLSCHDLLLLQ